MKQSEFVPGVLFKLRHGIYTYRYQPHSHSGRTGEQVDVIYTVAYTLMDGTTHKCKHEDGLNIVLRPDGIDVFTTWGDFIMRSALFHFSALEIVPEPVLELTSKLTPQ